MIEKYSISILVTLLFNDFQGIGIRVVASWDMNGSLPSGLYHSIPGALKVGAERVGAGQQLLHQTQFFIEVGHHSITNCAPSQSGALNTTSHPIQHGTLCPTSHHEQMLWYTFTCMTDEESTEWAPDAYENPCCDDHMNNDYLTSMGG